MATFNATFVRRLSQSNLGAHVEIPAGNGAVGPAALTTSGTAQRLQRGGSDWTADGEGFLVMTCDGAVRVGIGETPAAGSSPVGHYIPASCIYTVKIENGEWVEVIDA